MPHPPVPRQRPVTHHTGRRPIASGPYGRERGAAGRRHGARARTSHGHRGRSAHHRRPASGSHGTGGDSARARSASGTRGGRTSPRSIGHYVLGKALGEGTFGKVKVGTHILTGEKVAVKILEKSRIVEPADVERVSREIHILKRIRHRNVIQLFEVIDTPRHIFLIMEYSGGGELFDYIVKHQRVREHEAARFFHEICDGVEYLHSMYVTHRDLKPENLLMHRHAGGWKMKVIDFGLSNTCDGGRLLKTACGSPCYAAPEMIAGHAYVGSLADTWSLGVILFAMVCGYLPFEDQNTSRLYQKILHADYKPPKFISPQVRDLIARILNTDPRRRYTIRDIRAHPWMRQVSHMPSPTKALPTGHGDLSEVVLRRCEDLGLERSYVVDSIRRGAHNHATTTYYLVAERIEKEAARRARSSPARDVDTSRKTAAQQKSTAGANVEQPKKPASAVVATPRSTASGASDAASAASAAADASTAASKPGKAAPATTRVASEPSAAGTKRPSEPQTARAAYGKRAPITGADVARAAPYSRHVPQSARERPTSRGARPTSRGGSEYQALYSRRGPGAPYNGRDPYQLSAMRPRSGYAGRKAADQGSRVGAPRSVTQGWATPRDGNSLGVDGSGAAGAGSSNVGNAERQPVPPSRPSGRARPISAHPTTRHQRVAQGYAARQAAGGAESAALRAAAAERGRPESATAGTRRGRRSRSPRTGGLPASHPGQERVGVSATSRGDGEAAAAVPQRRVSPRAAASIPGQRSPTPAAAAGLSAQGVKVTSPTRALPPQRADESAAATADEFDAASVAALPANADGEEPAASPTWGQRVIHTNVSSGGTGGTGGQLVQVPTGTQDGEPAGDSTRHGGRSSAASSAGGAHVSVPRVTAEVQEAIEKPKDSAGDDSAPPAAVAMEPSKPPLTTASVKAASAESLLNDGPEPDPAVEAVEWPESSKLSGVPALNLGPEPEEPSAPAPPAKSAAVGSAPKRPSVGDAASSAPTSRPGADRFVPARPVSGGPRPQRPTGASPPTRARRPVPDAAHGARPRVREPPAGHSLRHGAQSSNAPAASAAEATPSAGSVQLMSSTSAKEPAAIMREVMRVVTSAHVPFRQVGDFTVRCQRMNTQFELEVAGVGVGEFHVVRAKPLSGDSAVIHEVTTQLLQELQL